MQENKIFNTDLNKISALCCFSSLKPSPFYVFFRNIDFFDFWTYSYYPGRGVQKVRSDGCSLTGVPVVL